MLNIPADGVTEVREALAALRPDVKTMSAGEVIEIYKEVGLPRDVAAALISPAWLAHMV